MEPLVRKRSGKLVPFSRFRIVNAIFKAMKAVGQGTRQDAEKVADKVAVQLYRQYFKKGDIPHVETIQDIIEKTLMGEGFPEVAKAYILYREKRRQAREIGKALVDGINLIEEYLGKEDWRVRENSNMNFSLQGLNFHVSSSIIARYWLEKLYPKDVAQAHIDGDFHIHDLGILGPYTYFGKEVIIAKYKDRLLTISFEALYEMVEEEEYILDSERKAYAKKPEKLFVLDKNGWTKVTRIVKKKKDKPMRFIKNRGGRSVIVTEDHPMITDNGEKMAKEVTGEDRLFTVDLKRLVANEKIFWQDKIDLLEEIIEKGWNFKEKVYFNGFPIEDYKFGEENGLLHTLSFSSPRYINLDEDFGYFTGFTLAEGYLSYEDDNTRCLSIVQKDVEILIKLNEILRKHGFFGCIVSKGNFFELRIRNPFLRFLFEKVFFISPGARNKGLPVEVLNYNLSFVKGLVAGLIDGDGSIDSNKTTLSIRIASRTMLNALSIVLSILGFTPRDRAIEGQGKEREIAGRKIVQRYPLYGVSFRKLEKIELPSEKYKNTQVSTKAWHDEEKDAWHKVINNEEVNIPDEWIYDITTETGTLIVNGMWNHNCVGWDLYDLLLRGFGGVVGKIESAPAKHFRSALGQIVNFFYTMQGEAAGAQAFSNFDTLLAPFIRYDKLSYPEVKQCIQEFLFNLNVPTRVGFQSLAWEEPVIIRKNGKIKILPIGELIDEEFKKHPDMILPNLDGYRNTSKDSFILPVNNGLEVLGWKEGKAVWLKVKGLVRHRVPHKKFIKIRTGRGEVFISPAHSLFAFDKNGKDIKPVTPSMLKTIKPNEKIEENSHIVGLKQVSVRCFKNLKEIDLVEIIKELPCEARSKIFVHLKEEAFEKIEKNIKTSGKTLKQAIYEFGYFDRRQYYKWKERKMVPFNFWLKYGDYEDGEIELSLRNYPEFKEKRKLAGKRLSAFLTILAFYITEGKASGTNFSISQAVPQAEEILSAGNFLGIISTEREFNGWSSKRKEFTSTKIKEIHFRGLLPYVIKMSAGFSSLTKEIPWYVFDLAPELKEEFLKVLFLGDGYYDRERNRYGFFSRSKKLIAGVAFLLASLGKYFVLSRKDKRTGVYGLFYYPQPVKPWPSEGDFIYVPVYEICEEEYNHEWEYDISVDSETECFIGGVGAVLYHNTPFTNLTFDLKPSKLYKDQAVIIGGKPQDSVYGEFHKEMSMINRAFCELMMEGDAKGRIFTFPIPTYNITKDFDWDNPDYEPLWEMTRKYGIPYFANFVNSDMDPDDARSMCCRLRLDQRELRKRGGGLFGANPLTGSIGVVTINLPRLGYFSTCEEEFFERLEALMELAKTSLEIKRKVIEDFTEKGLYPYSKVYLDSVKKARGEYWANHFSTIGIVGMNEACLNFLNAPIYTSEGKEFALKVLKFMREKIAEFQEQTGNLYNLEATPAEGTSYRLARIDKKKFPRIKTQGTPEVPYYTNSVHLPVNYTDDIFEILTHQDDLQVMFTGGTVVHLFVGEEIPDPEIVKELVRAIVTNFRLPYFSITPTFSVCPVHGYLPGKHEFCPYPHTKEDLERYGMETEVDESFLLKLPKEAYIKL